MKHILCDKCKNTINVCGYKNHYTTCNGIGPHNKRKRKYRRNPEKFIDWETVQKFYDEKHSWRDICKKFKVTYPTIIKAIKLKLFKSRTAIETSKLRNSKRGWATFSKETRSNIAKKLNFGGYRKNAGRSKKYHVKDSFGGDVLLQSSYELKLSEILNILEIKWIRPSYINYEINSKMKKYWPDFYLNEYEIYFDTKNDYLIKVDEEKIKSVRKYNPKITLEILDRLKISESFIKKYLNL